MLQNPHILLTFEEVRNPLRMPREAIFRLPPVSFFFVVQTMSCLPPMTGNEISIPPIYKNGDWGMVPGMVFVRAITWIC